jgi:hypothetical protein
MIKIWAGQVHPITLPFILPAWPYPYYIAHIEQYCQLGENTFVPLPQNYEDGVKG